ncbi:MAG: helix-turn-helix domain-containing protein [Tissierellia bacterium]|nr:helix-turn-helix domain-containing protein [Tissierellia bacterium]
MDLKYLMSHFNDMKYTLNFTEDIQNIHFGGASKNALNIIGEGEYTTERKGYTFLIQSEKEDYLQDRHNNIILVRKDYLGKKLNEITEILQENEKFYDGLLYRISAKEDFKGLIHYIKDYFKSNICILSSGQKLIYNIFDFNKVAKTFPLEVRLNRLTRRYAYFGFESLDEVYEEEVKKMTNLLGPLLYDSIREIVNHGDGFYEVLRNLVQGVFQRSGEKTMDTIDWGLKDDYTVIIAELVGGMYKYQEMFVHGNRFKMDHPMFMYSAIVDQRLVLLMNENFKELKYIKKETLALLEEYKLRYIEAGLKNDLLNLEKIYKIADFLLDEEIVPEQKITDSVFDLVYDMMVIDRDLSVIIPDELDIIVEEDRNYSSELTKTLYYYLAEERSLIKASEQLNVHRNSVVYRINKIEELVSIDFDDYKMRRNLMASLEILKRKYPELF